MKHKKNLIYPTLGILAALAVMWGRGLGQAQSAADRVLIMCDGFAVSALACLSIGLLAWASDTDFFDIFTYAFRKGAHAIVPMLFKEDAGNYYAYKLAKTKKRPPSPHKALLCTGLLLLAVSAALTVLWYKIIIL